MLTPSFFNAEDSSTLAEEGRVVEGVRYPDRFSPENQEETNQREVVSICGECPIPAHMTLITTLSDCTTEGRKFTDSTNDFSLEIPEGAIPEGERLTIDVGVALFGPFQFPEGLRPVSPVLGLCS